MDEHFHFFDARWIDVRATEKSMRETILPIGTDGEAEQAGKSARREIRQTNS